MRRQQRFERSEIRGGKTFFEMPNMPIFFKHSRPIIRIKLFFTSNYASA
jgi:hypothetical protein